ncbi:hypothetical protein M1P56_12830 [Streptomyces sp. HU2014]|uniref:terpene synthase family protein n=1 Tax=Streptomyces sp. HU2014 TaxID=2939414 RepID=UPI00200FA0AF|nr:hypothetical protein [Streptomyces sp. HU2014]UQI45169.1 hypothetical protein M1P56_12830 [Streptomyces sp. HU2014]
MATEITIPRIDVPFAPSRTNPSEGRLYPATLDWARRFGLVTTETAAGRLRRYQVDVMVSYYAPTVDGWPALRLFTDWMTWAALFEDQIDEATAGLRPGPLAPVLDDFRAVLLDESGSRARPNPATEALADLWRRTAGDGPPSWRRRFYEHMSEAFRCQLRASVHRATRTPMDVTTCRELRGQRPRQLPQGSRFRGDEQPGARPSDPAPICPQQAVDHVHRLITDRIQDFLKAGRELPGLARSLPLSDDDLSVAEQCLAHLRSLIRGSHDWHMN